MPLIDYSICSGIVLSYCDLLDIVKFEEKIGPYLVLCASVYYPTVRGLGPANYLFVKEVGYLL